MEQRREGLTPGLVSWFSQGDASFSAVHFFCAQALHATGYQEEGGAGGEYLATKINPRGLSGEELMVTFKS